MFCKHTKEYLSRKNIAFKERDVTADPSAIEDLSKLGYMTTPVTVVGSTVIVGFDTKRLDAALQSLSSGGR